MQLSKPVELEVTNRGGEKVTVKANKVRVGWEGWDFLDFDKEISINGGTLGCLTIPDLEAIKLLRKQGIKPEELEQIIEEEI